MQQDLEKSENKRSIKLSQMEKNLNKMRTLTQKIISPYFMEGHQQSTIDQLMTIEIVPQSGWTHVAETMNEAHKMRFYDEDNITIVQGELQDREFLNALALVINQKRLREYLVLEGEEKYVFRLYRKCQPISVVIDMLIPTTEHLPKYSRTSNDCSWVSLVEKAYSILYGGYEQIAGISLRDAIRDLTGLDPEIVLYGNPDNINIHKLHEVLLLLLENQSIIGFMMATSIEYNPNSKVRGSCQSTPNRMYVLKEIIDNNFTLEDNFEGKQLNLSKEDLLCSFNCIVCLKDFPDDWKGMKLDVTTTTHGIPNSNNTQWLNNPNYQFQVLTNDVPFVIRLSECEAVDGTVGIMLVNQRDVKTFNQNSIVYMTKPQQVQIGARKQNYSVTVQKLPKSYYTLYVFSNSKTEKQVLLEIFYAGKSTSVEFKFKSKSILETCFTGDDSRILRDIIKDKDMLLVPGNLRNQILNNTNAALIARPYNDSGSSDPEMACIIENQMQEELLGMNLEGGDPQDTNIYDLSNYCIGDSGLQEMTSDLIAETNIQQLKLAGNQLHDESILNLCYELEKAYHQELEVLDLSDNLLTSKGIEVVMAFKKKMKNLNSVLLSGNPGYSIKSNAK